VLLGFGPLVDHWGVGFGPWWTGKNRPLHFCASNQLFGDKCFVFMFSKLIGQCQII
jgi:hypothetical protein